MCIGLDWLEHRVNLFAANEKQILFAGLLLDILERHGKLRKQHFVAIEREGEVVGAVPRSRQRGQLPAGRAVAERTTRFIAYSGKGWAV